MRLREPSFFIKLSTHTDVADDGTILALLDSLEDLAGLRWDTSLDLLERDARVRRWAEVAHELSIEWLGQGTNRRLRRRWNAAESVGGFQEWLEVNAASHPYSGVFVTQIELRLARERFADPAFPSRFVAWADTWCAKLAPVDAHAHETDDHAIQNCALPALLHAGFGVDPESLGEDRPGREVSRGEYRYCATWWSFTGAPVLERLGHPDLAGLPGEVLRMDHGVRVLLTSDPLTLDESLRSAQRQLADVLGFTEAARKDRWTLGFWQKKV